MTGQTLWGLGLGQAYDMRVEMQMAEGHFHQGTAVLSIYLLILFCETGCHVIDQALGRELSHLSVVGDVIIGVNRIYLVQ